MQARRHVAAVGGLQHGRRARAAGRLQQRGRRARAAGRPHRARRAQAAGGLPVEGHPAEDRGEGLLVGEQHQGATCGVVADHGHRLLQGVAEVRVWRGRGRQELVEHLLPVAPVHLDRLQRARGHGRRIAGAADQGAGGLEPPRGALRLGVAEASPALAAAHLAEGDRLELLSVLQLSEQISGQRAGLRFGVLQHHVIPGSVLQHHVVPGGALGDGPANRLLQVVLGRQRRAVTIVRRPAAL
mmetsp:Transcript_84200/g.216772  ORF Transcript_84200/g.216772 Transcript_84200/m.216772 type:complete len:242 (+) Transcript_84200:449-1174(+)